MQFKITTQDTRTFISILLKNNIKIFEELIDTSSDKTYNLYT